MNLEKLRFLEDEYVPMLRSVDATTKGKWGKMDLQQMVEHVCDFFKVSTGKIRFDLFTPVEHLPKYKEFLLSEKEFRENTKAPVLPEEPFPARHTSFSAAIDELDGEIKNFIAHFKANPGLKTLHPAFGELDFSEWVQLHHKHVMHHAKQFNFWD